MESNILELINKLANTDKVLIDRLNTHSEAIEELLKVNVLQQKEINSLKRNMENGFYTEGLE